MTLFDLVTYSIWLSGGIGIFYFRRMNPSSLNVLVIFQIIAIISDIFLIYILPKEKGNFIKIFYSSLKPIEYAVFVYIYNRNISKKSFKFYYFVFSILLIFSFSVYTLLFLLSKKSAANNVIILEGILCIILVMLYFRDILSSKEIISLPKEPLFLIAIGIFLYFSGNIVATGFYHQLKMKSPDLAKSLYKLMNHLLLIFQYLMFAFAYYVANKMKLNE
ncbi:hypothetical protein Emtol_2864 [Emticicia oligotrophica DSM 17448]|uniref:Lysoplasmalogenase n=1 Tax=Emticicia oligotrophica (strain DSM 17448 / CIP 109782 / MTCC 6937 / GPTSA100-15) TaxID=929562 RepID=A0ABM5N3S8_EMTOG|nr:MULTISPECIES: hypothetical protein [Emticicia]AFK03997.1 hypothetical protein Emtol_2864 [Emticicia oligotrophica DSM 17448]